MYVVGSIHSKTASDFNIIGLVWSFFSRYRYMYIQFSLFTSFHLYLLFFVIWFRKFLWLSKMFQPLWSSKSDVLSISDFYKMVLGHFFAFEMGSFSVYKQLIFIFSIMPDHPYLLGFLNIISLNRMVKEYVFRNIFSQF